MRYIVSEDGNSLSDGVEQRITVKATDIDGIASALGMELVEEPESGESRDSPEELRDVLDTLADSFGGVKDATKTASRGRSRKMVRQDADRENLRSDDVGHIPRILEAHELVHQDGNRWQLPEAET